MGVLGFPAPGALLASLPATQWYTGWDGAAHLMSGFA